MTRRSPLLAIVLVPALLAGLWVDWVGAASPAAVFVSPTPGVISVVESGSFHVAWTVTEGAQVTATTLAVQASRPVGSAGCDPRWAPRSVQSMSGTSFDVSNLALDRCYRFVLLLATPSGLQSRSSVLWLSPNGC